MAEISPENALKIPNDRYVPVFPLPNVVLYPRVPLPLYIFEPRYRLMLDEVLDTHGKIAMALVKQNRDTNTPGQQDVHSVMGVGKIVTYTTRSDGTTDLLLVGDARAGVTSWREDVHYNRAKFETLVDVIPPSTTRREKLRKEIKGWLKQLKRNWQPTELEKLQEVATSHEDFGFLVDFIAHHFVHDSEEKQALLEELDVELRAQRLCKSLEMG